MTKPIITLTCDFGDRFASGQVESVVYGINPEIKFVLASREVTPYSITEGAFIIEKFAPFTPKGSIHIGVIDPGVGSDRIGLAVKTKNYWFVGPNNGLFYPVALQDGLEAVYQIDEDKIGSLSNTFHGRDLFAKVAAFLSINRPVEEYLIQIPNERLIPLEFQPDQILHIDPYGNIKLNNPAHYAHGDNLELKINEKSYIIPFVKTFAEVEIGQPLAYKGSHQTLELALNQQNAAEYFGLHVEDNIQIKPLGRKN